MKILAIDPGTIKSAYVLYDGKKILEKGIVDNNDILKHIVQKSDDNLYGDVDVVIEMIACNGMAVGREVFETVLWIGRMFQIAITCTCKVDLIFRKDIKMYLCNSMSAKDSNIRQALIDKLGATGTKKAPGFTYGVHDDIWSALAIAVYYYENKC